MTPLEVAAAIGAVAVPTIIPTGAVVISILRSEAKIDALSARMDAKIDGVSSRLDAKIEALGTRLDSKIDSKIDGLCSDMRGDMRVLDDIGYTHHGRLTKLELKANEKE